jgi:tricorn protease
MLSNTDLPRLFTVSVSGGLPKPLPFPSGTQSSFSPDGTYLAYVPGFKWQAAWKRYRGGQTSSILIGDTTDSKVKEIPRKNSNDTDPMWIDNRIYFTSDREGPVGIYRYDADSGRVSKIVGGSGFDVKSASAGPGAIVYEQLGSLHLIDLKTEQAKTVDIRVPGDFAEVRTKFKNVAQNVQWGDISPTGQRAVFEARGRIFSVPASKGDVRELTEKQGVAERFPVWSPNGKTISFFSDESGEYRMVLRDAQSGSERSLALGLNHGYFYSPVWSPDSKRIAYTDNEHNIWILDVDSGTNTKVDTFVYEDPTRSPAMDWSPDSKWLAYHRDLPSHLMVVSLYSLATGKSTQVTDGLSDAKYPAFDRGGKYLYFVSSTGSGPGAAWLDLTALGELNPQSAAYAVVLRNDTPDPLHPESDEEPVKDEAAKEEPKKDDAFRIDLDGLGQRIIPLPIPAGNYVQVHSGPKDSFFLIEQGPIVSFTAPSPMRLSKFSFADRKVTPFGVGVGSIEVSADGNKMLIQQGGSWAIVPTAAPAPGQGVLNLAGMTTKLDPMAEWRQMFREVIRIQRDFLYDPGHHGVNLVELQARYEPFLANLRSRDDLNYLFEDMLGELSIGHMFISGGDIPSTSGPAGGLLGADLALENGKYRLTRVYNGESWNPQLRAPLTQPGIGAKAGEYILAVNGREVGADDNLYEALEGKAGKQVRIKIGPNPNGDGAREVTVVPTGSEFGLRTLAWEEDNRRRVAEMTGGRVAYVHIPDTNVGGWTNFRRYYFAQSGKEALIVDDRFNHGGSVDNYMVETMALPLRSMWTSRYGKDFSSPALGIFGPKVMITNEYAGSGGDYFPWHFRQLGLGKIVGKRTWGGLVGILAFPPLIDGGSVTAPNVAFYNPTKGEWEVENVGISPDIEVELDPYLWRQGKDAQLERAIAEAMKSFNAYKPPVIRKPKYEDKTKIK